MRARSIKPGICDNEVLGTADPFYTLLFERLWMIADREGRLEDRPLRIKAQAFPYRDGLDIEPMLVWLVENGFIARYKAAGTGYIQILSFLKHQNPHKNEVASIIPPMAEQSQPLDEVIPPSPERLGLTPSSLTPDSGLLTPDCSTLATSPSAEDGQSSVAPLARATRSKSPEGEMAVTLRDLGVRCTSMDQTLKAWVRDGFTVQQVVDATALARMRKPYPEPIPVNYLDPILRKPHPPPKTQADRVTWRPPPDEVN